MIPSTTPGVMLSELMAARDKHGDALTWLGRFVTR